MLQLIFLVAMTTFNFILFMFTGENFYLLGTFIFGTGSQVCIFISDEFDKLSRKLNDKN